MQRARYTSSTKTGRTTKKPIISSNTDVHCFCCLFCIVVKLYVEVGNCVLIYCIIISLFHDFLTLIFKTWLVEHMLVVGGPDQLLKWCMVNEFFISNWLIGWIVHSHLLVALYKFSEVSCKFYTY